MKRELRLIEFNKSVKEIVRNIPEGKVLTYGDLASLAGEPYYSRQVGKILGAIGFDSDIPCHRVVNVQGRTAPHWLSQIELLKREGVKFNKSNLVIMKDHRWHPELD